MNRTAIAASLSYAGILAAFWATAQYFGVPQSIGGHFITTFVAFALMFAPFWFFGFGAAPWLRERLRSADARLLLPAVLGIPYVIYAFPRGEYRWEFFLVFVGVPVLVAGLLEWAAEQDRDPSTPPAGAGLARDDNQQSLSDTTSGAVRLDWRDLVSLALLGTPIALRLLGAAFPHAGLGSFAKLLMVDAGLYGFLVVRQLPGVGFDFRPKWRDLLIGLREFSFYAPIALTLGFALHFLGFHDWLPRPQFPVELWLVTFFFVAIPEEMFFRGFFQNLLETRFSPRAALLIASVVFGLSHFNKPHALFNWRYVIMATIAGVFYGRAWRDRRRVFSSAITHATIDTVWSVWFR